MSAISPIDFMKFCISQGFEFVLVDDDNKIINRDNVEEIESILDRSNLIPFNYHDLIEVVDCEFILAIHWLNSLRY